MDAPIESLPPVARERLETIEKRMNECGAVRDHTLIEKFWLGIAAPFGLGPWFIEKGLEEAEQFVQEWFVRDAAWVRDAADSLYAEAQVTARKAIEAQMKSAFGKSLPDGFQFSQNQLAIMRNRALQSAQSIAKTYNAQIPKWIQTIKDEWIKEHGSLRGLNRWTIIKRAGRLHHDFLAWKNRQIATTEFSQPWASATQEFWNANSGRMELEYMLSPNSASDPERDTEPICMEYINRWLTKDEAYMFPAHINCVHYISETRAKSGAAPIALQIGDALYMTEDL